MIDRDRAKAHLKVDYDTEDDLIDAYLAAAIAAVEKRTGRILSPRALTQRLDAFPGSGRFTGCRQRSGIALHHDPVVSVEGVDYFDADGETQTLTVDDGGFRTVAGEPYLLLPSGGGTWPYCLAEQGAVTVRYTAGYGDGEGLTSVPAELDAAVLMMVGHLFRNREAVAIGPAATELPLGVKAFCDPFRRVGIA